MLTRSILEHLISYGIQTLKLDDSWVFKMFSEFLLTRQYFHKVRNHVCKVRISFSFGCYFCDLADNWFRFSNSLDYIVLISLMLNSERISMKSTVGKIIWGQKVIYAFSTTFRTGSIKGFSMVILFSLLLLHNSFKVQICILRVLRNSGS